MTNKIGKSNKNLAIQNNLKLLGAIKLHLMLNEYIKILQVTG